MKTFIIILCVIFISVAGPGLTMLSADMAYPPRKQQEEKKKVEKKVEKKEEKKVEKKEEIQKVWTNDDLKKVKDVNITIVESDNKTQAKAAANTTATKSRRTRKPQSKPVATKPDIKTTEKYWQNRKNNIIKQIQETETRLKQMESRAAELQGKYLITEVYEQLRKIEEEYSKLYYSIKNHKEGLVKLKQSLEDLRKEARKAGIPPGWVR